MVINWAVEIKIKQLIWHVEMHTGLRHIERIGVFLRSNNQNCRSRVTDAHRLILRTPEFDQKCPEFNNFWQKTHQSSAQNFTAHNFVWPGPNILRSVRPLTTPQGKQQPNSLSLDFTSQAADWSKHDYDITLIHSADADWSRNYVGYLGCF